MKTEVLSNYNNFYPKYGTQHFCPYGCNTYMAVISMSSLPTKEKKIILVTCITRILKEIITLIKLSSVLPVSAIL